MAPSRPSGTAGHLVIALILVLGRGDRALFGAGERAVLSAVLGAGVIATGELTGWIATFATFATFASVAMLA